MQYVRYYTHVLDRNRVRSIVWVGWLALRWSHVTVTSAQRFSLITGKLWELNYPGKDLAAAGLAELAV